SAPPESSANAKGWRSWKPSNRVTPPRAGARGWELGASYIFRKTASPESRAPQPLPGTREMPAAVDRNRLSRHPRRAVGGEEDDQLRDLLRLSGAAERMRLLRALEERGVSLFVHAGTPVQVSDGDPRIHRVHAHTERRHLDRGAARQVIDARLAHAVREHAGKRSESVHARHVHDRAAPRSQVRRRRAHQPE